MKALVGWLRQQPAPANNIIDEALANAFAMTTGVPFDVQRVYQLVGVETGTNGVSVWHDGEAKIIGRTIDLLLRAVARPDQANYCAARIADMSLALHMYDFGDASTMQQENQYLLRLAESVAAQRGPLGPNLLSALQEYRRGPLAPHAQWKVGKPWFESFGAASASFPGPVWEDPFNDGHLKDGRDPATTKTGHVEGW